MQKYGVLWQCSDRHREISQCQGDEETTSVFHFLILKDYLMRFRNSSQ